MKFYDCATAPSPRRVRIFLAEKGLTVPTVQVDLRNGKQFTPVFRALNPDCMVPVLELDSGAAITDIIAICRYFEELHPEPSLMGRTAEERAVIESRLRRIEWDGIYAAQEAFRNATPGGQSLARSCIPRTDSGARGARASSASAFLCMARCAPGLRPSTKMVQRRFDPPERQSLT
jgi:glutathione S-transferase